MNTPQQTLHEGSEAVERMGRRQALWGLLGGLLIWLGLMSDAHAEMVMKVLIVNPSETEVKEFPIRYPLPQEVKREHVLDADGLKVDYDAEGGTYVLVGTVTLKPKESITKRILLEDVWVIGPEQFTALRKEMQEIMEKLEGTSYKDQGQLLASAIERKVADIEENQNQPVFNPMQHITRYREDTKKLQMVESDLVSLRQLMVMAALNPSTSPSPSGATPATTRTGTISKGSLSLLATWWIVFAILGLLGFVSLSFFLVWQRQLRLQLDKQALQKKEVDPLTESLTNGHGITPTRTDIPAGPSATKPALPT